MTPIYLSSIALERHRWKRAAPPATQASLWIDPAKSHGFDGMELFERHFTEASEEEKARLIELKEFIPILNGYAGFDKDALPHRALNASLAKQLNCQGLKFNVGRDSEKATEYVEAYQEWAPTLPSDCTPLCECHGGTVIETPESALKFFDSKETAIPGIITHLTSPKNEDSANNDSPPALRWMETFGENLMHIHIQTRNALFEEDAQASERHIKSIMDHGFKGSWSLEFSYLCATPQETIELMWQNLQKDFDFLKSCLSKY